MKFSLGKGKGDAKERFATKLEKLFDISNCKFQITSCENEGCEACVIHINCSCIREKKIPVRDLAYIKGQKEEVGSKGSHHMKGLYLPEHKRQASTMERHWMKNKAEQRRISKEKYPAGTEKAARIIVTRFLEDGDEDQELE